MPPLEPALIETIVRHAQTICESLGYEMNTIEFAIQDDVPYAIDYLNPAPDMDINSLTPHYFEWAVQKMADMAIRLATGPRRQPAVHGGEFLLGRREGGR